MKKILLSLAAVAMLAACSKEDTLVQQAPEAIGFDNAFVENSTRSKYDPSFSSAQGGKMFSDFAVFGFVEGATLFDGAQNADYTRVAKEDLATDQTKTGWEYAGTQYWIAGANYDFYAVAPYTGDWAVKADTTPASTGAVITFTNKNGTQDLLYSGIVAQEGKVSGNANVGFTFKHILSKVKFSFENAYNATNATIKVRDVKITDAYATGDATLAAAAAWSTQSGKLELAFGNAVADDATSTDAPAFACNTTLESYNELFMIPGAGPTVVDGEKTYTVTFIVDLLVSDSVVKSYNHTINAVFAPEAGKSYDLKATINAKNIDPKNEQEPIEFTVNTLPDWGTTNNQDI